MEFTELVSEGSMVLLRAAEKFDCGRGFRFSTYACQSILRSFSRLAKKSYRYRSLFSVQWDPALEKDDHLDSKRNETRDLWVSEIRTVMCDNLAGLSGVERSVVEMRFSMTPGHADALTLKQVGKKLGLSKERIRQIQNNALAKLRIAMEERVVAS